MYQALYRKWRPKVFADVKGQEHITTTLKNELNNNRLSHAYLFTGSRGTGKTTCAKILSKAVNCLKPKDGDPCGKCDICLGLDNGSILDVSEIDAASNNGVDNIRDLREEAAFTPVAAKYRVYIIDEVHMLSAGAFNALLKTLEEPPPHVLFILATTEAHKIPATILSRCQRFDFKRIDPEAMTERLVFVAKKEGAKLDNDAALLIARLADGALRDALSILDQCIGQSKTVDSEVVCKVAGLAGREYLYELSECVKKRDSSNIIEIIDRLHGESLDMERLCEELIGHFRNLMILKTVKDGSGFITLSKSEIERLSEQATGFPLPLILYSLDMLESTLSVMRSGLNKRVETEMLLIKLCNPELMATNEALVARIEALELKLRSGVKIEASPEKPAKAAENTVKKDTPPAPSASESSGEPQKMTQWQDVISVLKTRNTALAMSIQNSVAYIDGSRILIDNDNDYFLSLIKQENHKEDLKQAIFEITGKKHAIGPYRKQESGVSLLDKIADSAEKSGVEVVRK